MRDEVARGAAVPLIPRILWLVRGLHLFTRFLVNKEPFPKFLEPEDYFRRYVLSELKDASSGVSYAASYAVHKRMLEKFSIHTNHILHQGRGQLQVCGDDRALGTLPACLPACLLAPASFRCVGTIAL